jgi:hypothetical protein
MDNSTNSTPRTYKTDLKFWLMWVIASTAAILISAVVLYGLIFIAKAIYPSINEDRAFGISMFPVIATMFGVLQWLVLRKRIPKSGWWILATVIGLGGGIALAVVAAQAFSHFTGQEEYWNYRPGLLTLFLLIGFFLALAQLPILWHHFRGSLLWLLASMMGWLFLGLIMGGTIDRISDVFAIGAIPAMFTGFCLIWLMRNPRTKPDHSP